MAMMHHACVYVGDRETRHSAGQRIALPDAGEVSWRARSWKWPRRWFASSFAPAPDSRPKLWVPRVGLQEGKPT